MRQLLSSKPLTSIIPSLAINGQHMETQDQWGHPLWICAKLLDPFYSENECHEPEGPSVRKAFSYHAPVSVRLGDILEHDSGPSPCG